MKLTSYLILVPLAAAVAVVAYGARALGRDVLARELGAPTWDFSQNFASMLTLGGALLSTVLSAGVLPHRTHYMPRAGYAGLSLLFGMIVLLAPLAFMALPARRDGGELLGYVWGFLVAAAITLWGVGGELATVGVLFKEIDHARSLGAVTVWTLWLVLAGIALAMVVYSVRRIAAIDDGPDVAISEAGEAAPRAARGWSPL